MRRLPLCAHCGTSLARRPRILIHYEKLVGKPWVGWHIENLPDPCVSVDLLGKILVNLPRRCTLVDILWALRAIEQRGKDRLAVNPH